MSRRRDADHVLVWWLEVTGLPADTVARWHARLDPAEQARADRFHFAADRDAYVTAHALRRALLSHAFGLPPAAWRFVDGPFGKPELDPALGVDAGVSLSHTRGLAAVAVCAGHAVGIDVEACDRRDVGLALAERYFAPDEVAQLQGASPDRMQELFFRLWTLKEAYLKATGEGLSRSLNSFGFTLEESCVVFRSEADDPADWQFFERRPTTGHVLAVALRRQADRPARLAGRAVRPSEL